jgi:nucleotidyltransferase substrate binding protein (TIGR01987 family)
MCAGANDSKISKEPLANCRAPRRWRGNDRFRNWSSRFDKAFEFTHELAWNTLKGFLQDSGTSDLFGSKDATREAFAAGLIENGDVWMAMIQSRSQTTHTYDQAISNGIASAIRLRYVAEFKKFQNRFTALEGKET